MLDKKKAVEILDELRNFADNDVHPVVSPENWHVYSKLRDLIDQAEEDTLALLKEQEAIKFAREFMSDAVHETAKQFRRQEGR